MKRLLLLLALALAVAAAPARVASAQALAADPGYLDLSRVDAWFSDEPTVEIDLRGSLLRMVTNAARSDDPELATMMQRMRAVQVRVYELVPSARASARTRAADMMRGLERQGWESFVRVRQDGQYVNMMVRPQGGSDAIAGLVVAVIDEEDDEPQAVFINIVGNVDPARIGQIGGRVGVPNLPNTSRRSSRHDDE